MSDKDQTINFIPGLLNKSPIVFKMMTFTELLFVLAISSAVGLLIGLLFCSMLQVTMLLSLVFALIFGVAGVSLGGFVVSRLKRGKPETWLERWIEFKLNTSRFITRDQQWSLKRSRRGLK